MTTPDFLADAFEFFAKFDLVYDGPPRQLPPELLRFRIDCQYEECDEYAGADTLHERLDALVDLVYFALGTAHLHGFDFAEAWRRVHAANMKKVRAASASDSKRNSGYDVVKPPGWRPADLTDLVSG